MLNYKLAKQLKEAGFPQEFANCTENGINYYAPILSELIEACGEDFSGLTYFCGRKKHKWEAESCCDIDKEWVRVKAESPDEAVAKLYLKLKEK